MADDSVATQLRDKVKSKMDVAKFFSGFITLLIGFLMKDGKVIRLESRAGIGVVLLISSLGFCIASMIAYDHLMWPRKYWPERSSEERFQERCKKEMLKSWTWLFVPAVGCFLIGFLLWLMHSLSLPAPPAAKLGVASSYLLLLLAVVTPIGICIKLWPHDIGKSVEEDHMSEDDA